MTLSTLRRYDVQISGLIKATDKTFIRLGEKHVLYSGGCWWQERALKIQHASHCAIILFCTLLRSFFVFQCTVNVRGCQQFMSTIGQIMLLQFAHIINCRIHQNLHLACAAAIFIFFLDRGQRCKKNENYIKTSPGNCCIISAEKL